MEIKLYVEGGGKNSHKLATIKIQQGFDAFFSDLKQQARAKNVSFRIIPSSNTQTTFDDFMKSVRSSSESVNLLLVDSDEAVAGSQTARAFLQRKHPKWNLASIADEQCHLMVQIMESWFLADVDALKKFYGKDFKENALPKNANVEAIEKKKVEDALKVATAKTQKGEYHKIEHGTKLLEIIDSQKVRRRALHCDRLFKIIAEKTK